MNVAHPVILLILITAFTPVIQALVGYNCQGKGLNTSVISLESVSECEWSLDNVTSSEEIIQLVQLTDEYPINVISCKVEITRVIYYCGMHSHSSIVKNGHVS